MSTGNIGTDIQVPALLGVLFRKFPVNQLVPKREVHCRPVQLSMSCLLSHRRRSREDRSPSVEIIYEGPAGSHGTYKRHRKHNHRTPHSRYTWKRDNCRFVKMKSSPGMIDKLILKKFNIKPAEGVILLK